jgi:glucosamine-6-phosphate deaminase
MSQAAMLEFLVHENLDWSRVTAFHSDEYAGITADHPGSLRKFLKDRFVEWVPGRLPCDLRRAESRHASAGG